MLWRCPKASRLEEEDEVKTKKARAGGTTDKRGVGELRDSGGSLPIIMRDRELESGR